jgi:predicted amidohydrolase YtcJ
MEQLQKEKSLKMNVYAMLDPSKENMDFFVKKGIYKTDRMHVCSIKLYADGALGSRGALLLEPYADDPGNSGILVENMDTLKYYCQMAFDNNYQVCTHAIGDSAVRTVLKLYAQYLKQDNDRRWRIEHSQVVDKADVPLFGQYNIVPSVQPVHATSDMYWADERLGPVRVKNAYSYKDLMEQNKWIPFGTDFPIEKVDPLLTFYAAVYRKDVKGYPETGFQIENAVSKEDALRGITIWAAKSCFEDTEKGSLEPGKFSDFVILDKDIMTVPGKDILTTRILSTYIRGEKVYGE